MLDMLTVQELCALLVVKPWKLREWRKLGNGPYYIKLDGHYLYPIKELKRWLNANKYRHEAQEALKKEEDALATLQKEIKTLEQTRKTLRAKRRELLLQEEGLV
jgi:hypothetical protein